jgi:transcriptional regulator with XRE-family HTH domain
MAAAEQDRSLGERVRRARLAQGLTLRELARRIQRAPSYVNDIEYDRRVPSEGVVREICGVLELDFDSMLGSAGRLGEEAERYLKREPTAGVLFRRVSRDGLRDEDLKKLIAAADRLAKQRRATPPTPPPSTGADAL